MKTIPKLLVFYALQLLLIFPNLLHAQIQEITSLKALTIELMPEFDNEGILVIYKGALHPNTPFPSNLTMQLPANININAVAFRDREKKRLLLGKYVAEPKGNGTQITLTANADNFWIEFYTSADAISRNDIRRTFSYSWADPISINELTWHIQKPIKSEDFSVSPAGGEMIKGDYGISTYQTIQNNVDARATSSVTVSYVKKDNAFTSTILSGSTATADSVPLLPDGQKVANGGKTDYLPITLAILALVLIAIGLIVFWPSGSKKE